MENVPTMTLVVVDMLPAFLLVFLAHDGCFFSGREKKRTLSYTHTHNTAGNVSSLCLVVKVHDGMRYTLVDRKDSPTGSCKGNENGASYLQSINLATKFVRLLGGHWRRRRL